MRRSLTRAGGLALGIGLVLLAGPALALIQRLYPLGAVIRDSQFVFTARVEKIDSDRPAVVLTVDEDLKGKAPFRRLAVNLKGDAEAAKGKHTPKLLRRLAPGLPIVGFAYPNDKGYVVFAYTNGTWFQVLGVKGDDDALHWRYTHCEPYLRRTYKGSTAEFKQVIADALAGKKEPPAPDPKAEPGFGPEVKPGDVPKPGGKEEARAVGGPLFAVIPTVLVGGPLAILALLFPAVFGRLALSFRRWLVVLTVLSVGSTLYVVHGLLAPWIYDTWYGSPLALWVALTLTALAGLLWAWRRHAAALARQAPDTERGVPQRRELTVLWVVSLLGLAFVAACLLGHAPLLDESWRKLTLVALVGIWGGTLHTLSLRRRAEKGTASAALPVEGVMLAGMAVGCTVLGLTTLPRAAAARGTTTGGDQAAAADGRRAVVAWKFEAPAAGWFASSPLVAGDRVYQAAAPGDSLFQTHGTLYCLDRATGKPVWTFDNDQKLKPVFSTPCLANGRLYIGEGFHQDNNCKLYCLDAASGKKLWEHATASHTESSPCVVDGKVYCGAGDDGLLCLDAGSGAVVWHFQGLHVDCSPVVAGKHVYAGSGKGDTYHETCLFCLDRETGTEVWRVPTDLPVWGAPAAAGPYLYVGLGNGDFESSDPKPAGAVLCVEAATGRQVWRCDVADAVLNRPAVGRHLVYFGSRDQHGYGLDRRDGREAWHQDLGGPVVTAPALAVGGVYVVGSGGRVCCLDPDTGAANWTFDLRNEVKGRPKLYSSPAVTVTREAGRESRRLYFGAGIESPLGTTAVLYCLEERPAED
jgi:outer membrane protein assembly factor BamB